MISTEHVCVIYSTKLVGNKLATECRQKSAKRENELMHISQTEKAVMLQVEFNNRNVITNHQSLIINH